ncbi:methylenetetrahydrofolate reductase [Thermaerobacter litoralis]
MTEPMPRHAGTAAGLPATDEPAPLAAVAFRPLGAFLPCAALADGDPGWTLALEAGLLGPARPGGASGSAGRAAPDEPAALEAAAAEQLAPWPLTAPGRVEAVHLAALRAGARLIRTHTRWASPAWLPRTPAARIEAINLQAAKLARSARELAGQPCLVAGFLGPGPTRRSPAAGGEAAEPGALQEAYRCQVAGLLAGGVDLFWIEAADPREAVAALVAVREASRLPAGVLWHADGAGPEAAPDRVREGLRILAAAGWPDALGVVAPAGPETAVPWLAALRRAGWSGPLWVALGTAGGPIGPAAPGDPGAPGHLHPVDGPGDGAEGALHGAAGGWDGLFLLGVGWVGGAGAFTGDELAHLGARLGARLGAGLGTRLEARGGAPQGIGPDGRPWPGAEPAGSSPTAEALPGAVRLEVRGGLGPQGNGTVAGPARPEPPAASPGGSPAPLREKLGRRFVISVELDPPRGPVATKFLADARTVAAAGADAVNVGDSPMARPRMAALAGALLVRSAGVDAIMHCTTRDRNLMALQADLLAAHALGVRNVLALTGDHPRLGTSRASAVYDVDSIGLLEILAALRRGEDPQGNALGAPAEFTVACALSPCAEDLDRELDRFRRKLAVGVVDFVMTQPLYEVEPLERVLDRLGGCPVPLVMGVMPLHSGRHAHYLHHQVPGITIPAPIREALDRAGDRGLEVGLELAEAVVEAARPYIAGIYVVVSYGKTEPVAEFVRRLRARFDPVSPASPPQPAGPSAATAPREEVRPHAG